MSILNREKYQNSCAMSREICVLRITISRNSFILNTIGTHNCTSFYLHFTIDKDTRIAYRWSLGQEVNMTTPHKSSPIYGQYFRLQRRKRGWSQEKTAPMFGIKQATLSRLELGLSPWTTDYIEKAAGVLGQKPEDFFRSAQHYRPSRGKNRKQAA